MFLLFQLWGTLAYPHLNLIVGHLIFQRQSTFLKLEINTSVCRSLPLRKSKIEYETVFRHAWDSYPWPQTCVRLRPHSRLNTVPIKVIKARQTSMSWLRCEPVTPDASALENGDGVRRAILHCISDVSLRGWSVWYCALRRVSRPLCKLKRNKLCCLAVQ
jgi:hypothetical protein